MGAKYGPMFMVAWHADHAGMLARYGIEITFFDPLIGVGIEKAVQAEHNRPPPHRCIPGFLRGTAANHPFTMTTNPAVLSTK